MARTVHCAAGMVLPTDRGLAGTGIEGLDDILRGGFPRSNVYLVHGDPGVGKTTLGMRFVLEGARLGEKSLYVTLAESRDELAQVAHSHGWSIDSIEVAQLKVNGAGSDEEHYSIYHPAEVELSETINALLAHVDRVKPSRLVVDSLSEVRLMAQHPLRFRRQVLNLKQSLLERGCTVLLLDDRVGEANDGQLQSLAHGVVTLDKRAPNYGMEQRRVRIDKLRGVAFRSGYHDVSIVHGGLVVYPRLVAGEFEQRRAAETVSTGVGELDVLLGGGLTTGSTLLLIGPPGAGKSALLTQFVCAGAARGERSTIYTFDETRATALHRASSMRLGLDEHIEKGLAAVRQIDPAEMQPGEFVHNVAERVVRDGAKIIGIDSLNGFLNAMPDERFVLNQLHELFAFLNQRGVVTVVTAAQSGLLGPHMHSPIDVSYLADSVILFRYFETHGEMRNALSVVKNRFGAHERTIREVAMSPRGIEVGPPLREFEGILTGVPRYVGERSPLIRGGDQPRAADGAGPA